MNTLLRFGLGYRARAVAEAVSNFNTRDPAPGRPRSRRMKTPPVFGPDYRCRAVAEAVPGCDTVATILWADAVRRA